MVLEQRKLKRRQLIYYLKVMDSQTEQPIGRLVDITTEGLMLVSSQPIALDKVYSLKMDLPAEMNQLKSVKFDAQSLWSNRDVNPDFIDTGFKFVDVSSNDISAITDLIEDFELPS